MSVGTTPSYGSTLTRMLREVGPPRLKELGNSMAPFKKALRKHDESETHMIKRIRNGGNHTFGFYADGATTPDGVTNGFGSFTVLGKLFHGAIQVNLAAAIQTRGKKKGTAKLLQQELDAAAKYAGRQLNHALIRGDGELALATAGRAALFAIKGDTTTESAAISATWASELHIGQGLDIYEGSNLRMNCVVTDITLNFLTGAHTFKVKNADLDVTADTAWTTNADTASAYIRGAKDNGVLGLVDAIASSGDIYGQSVSIPGWKSTEVAAGGPIAEGDVRKALVSVRAAAGNGMGPTMLVMNENRLNDLYETRNSLVRYGSDAAVTIADYKSLDKIAGLPVVVDESVGDETIYGVDGDNISLAVFFDMFNLGDGPAGMDHGQGHFIKPRNKLAYEAELFGMYELDVDCRHTSFVITGITY